MNQESFHTHHSPFGAFASFTLGLVNSTGGFGQSLSRPSQVRQNVYIGYRCVPSDGVSAEHGSTASGWTLLPFFTPAGSSEARFTGEAAVASMPESGANFTVLTATGYERTLGLASDTWRADQRRFGFSILTPFTKVGDPRELGREDARHLLAPALPAWIEYDNRHGETPVELIFGIGDPERPWHPLEEGDAALAGFASGTDYGYATLAANEVECRLGFDVFNPRYKDRRSLHCIGGESALVFTVAPGELRRFPLSLGFYCPDSTTGVTAHYAYTRFFCGIEDVLAHTLAEHVRYQATAASRDGELERSGLTAAQRFLLAQAVHSYYGSTQLMWNVDGPLWIVNEGEYRMINTFDLTVDHLFFELAWHPWAVRDTLNLFDTRYCYTDRIKTGADTTAPGGIAFTHDMGVMNYFTPPGVSSYECAEQSGCFSHMTMEQLLNWILCATTYAQKTNDTDWLSQRQQTLLNCAESLRRRDHPEPSMRDGILKFDSARCGKMGAEITTYDSLDVSLGQARNNLYLAVKTLGAWILLEYAFRHLNLPEAEADARATGQMLADSIVRKFDHERGCFPAIFENNNHSCILPAVEGFVYPLFLGYGEATSMQGYLGDLLRLLRTHIAHALQPGICLDAVSGGWKISSTSTNTWFSKIALAQYAIRRLFPDAANAEAERGDVVHARWQSSSACGQFAMCDQITSTNGECRGSRYYPRGVTSWLWMAE